jgi:hypothetical protein
MDIEENNNSETTDKELENDDEALYETDKVDSKESSRSFVRLHTAAVELVIIM